MLDKLDAAVVALFPKFKKNRCSPTVAFNDDEKTTFADVQAVLKHAKL